VIEAPPTRDSPDAQTLANVAELAVLVVEAADTSAHDVLDACAQLESVHTAVLGAVIARYGRDSTVDRRGGETVEADEPAPVAPEEPSTAGDAGSTEAVDADEATAEPAEDAEQEEEKVPSGATASGTAPAAPGVTVTQEIPAIGHGTPHDRSHTGQQERPGDDVVPTTTRPALVPPTTQGPAPR
jgi:hypothetical protein